MGYAVALAFAQRVLCTQPCLEGFTQSTAEWRFWEFCQSTSPPAISMAPRTRLQLRH